MHQHLMSSKYRILLEICNLFSVWLIEKTNSRTATYCFDSCPNFTYRKRYYVRGIAYCVCTLDSHCFASRLTDHLHPRTKEIRYLYRCKIIPSTKEHLKRFDIYHSLSRNIISKEYNSLIREARSNLIEMVFSFQGCWISALIFQYWNQYFHLTRNLLHSGSKVW